MNDGKYDVAIRDGAVFVVQRATGEPIPDDEPVFLLRARDRLAIPLLNKYFQLAWKDRCNEYHLSGILRAIKAFEDFTTEFPERMKQPGITMGQKMDGKG